MPKVGTKGNGKLPPPIPVITDSATLDIAIFTEPKFVVPGYVTEGLVILAGRPKIGKSWLALGLADAVARGGMALGQVEVEAGDVLYLALEDIPRRLQKRMRAIRQGAAPSPRLHLATQWERLDDGGIDQLRGWLTGHPSARLVVVDTFQKVRGKVDRDAGVYSNDYQAVTPLKALADEFEVAILILAHLRKASADDPLDEISGSTGLTAAADTILILKRDRANADAVLFGTGRDVEEIESALQFDTATGLWSLLGDAYEFRQSKERQAILREMQQAGTPMTPKALAAALGKNLSTTQNLLIKMVKEGQAMRIGTGKYAAAIATL